MSEKLMEIIALGICLPQPYNMATFSEFISRYLGGCKHSANSLKF